MIRRESEWNDGLEGEGVPLRVSKQVRVRALQSH